MKAENYNCSFNANASAHRAFEGINHVSEWWAKNFEGNSEKQNDVFTVRFGETFVTFKVTESIPDKKIAWKVTDCYLHWINAKKEWNDTELIFEILSEDNSIKVNFTHIGLEPQVECYNDCSTGWNHHLKTSLAKLMTEGAGTPQ